MTARLDTAESSMCGSLHLLFGDLCMEIVNCATYHLVRGLSAVHWLAVQLTLGFTDQENRGQLRKNKIPVSTMLVHVIFTTAADLKARNPVVTEYRRLTMGRQ